MKKNEEERIRIMAKADYIASLSRRIGRYVPVPSTGGLIVLDMLASDMRRLVRQAETCKAARLGAAVHARRRPKPQGIKFKLSSGKMVNFKCKK